MRIRTIKPDFWQSRSIAKLSDRAKLLAIALLNYSDDQGYFKGDPSLVDGALFPFDSGDSWRTPGALLELSRSGYVAIYDGLIGHVVKFLQHQRIDKPSESKLKAQCGKLLEIIEIESKFVELYGNPPGVLLDSSSLEVGSRKLEVGSSKILAGTKKSLERARKKIRAVEIQILEPQKKELDSKNKIEVEVLNEPKTELQNSSSSPEIPSAEQSSEKHPVIKDLVYEPSPEIGSDNNNHLLKDVVVLKPDNNIFDIITLCASAFERIRGAKYAVVRGNRDFKAVKDLLQSDYNATPEEIVRRFTIGLSARFPPIANVYQIVPRWNEFAIAKLPGDVKKGHYRAESSTVGSGMAEGTSRDITDEF